jgi:hypothetical protein
MGPPLTLGITLVSNRLINHTLCTQLSNVFINKMLVINLLLFSDNKITKT